MRMRRKPNLEPRLEQVCEYLIDDPKELSGRWLDEFSGFRGIYVELGCGKGRFTCELAKLYPDILFIGVERVPDALLLALERAKQEALNNIRFIKNDVKILHESFASGEILRIYINFCDPWPGNRHAKRRLTSDDFLAMYKTALAESGEIHFKTDNVPLFEYSLKRFEACGFELREVTRDLHGVETSGEQSREKGLMTNYEEKFHALGMKINRCVAVASEVRQ